MKKTIRKITISLLFILEKFHKIFSHKKNVAVLMYHSTADNNWEHSISPRVLESHIRYLKNKNYDFLGTKQLATFLKGEPTDFKKGVMLTFDDGYKDFLDAVPVLARHNVPAVLFVHTNRSSDNLGNNYELLNWQDIKEISQKGIEIGNHTHSHPDIKNLDSENFRSEFEQSEKLLSEKIGSVPRIFAYPGGKFSQSAVDVLKQRGYQLAFTINSGLVSKNDDRLRLRRIGITKDTSMFEFSVFLTPVSTWYQNIRKYAILRKIFAKPL